MIRLNFLFRQHRALQKRNSRKLEEPTKQQTNNFPLRGKLLFRISGKPRLHQVNDGFFK